MLAFLVRPNVEDLDVGVGVEDLELAVDVPRDQANRDSRCLSISSSGVSGRPPGGAASPHRFVTVAPLELQ